MRQISSFLSNATAVFILEQIIHVQNFKSLINKGFLRQLRIKNTGKSERRFRQRFGHYQVQGQNKQLAYIYIYICTNNDVRTVKHFFPKMYKMCKKTIKRDKACKKII